MINSDSLVTALVPCFNEETRVGSVLKVLLNSKDLSEVIVVNDGSTDGSRKVIESIKNNKLKIINLASNRGKGQALKEGLKSIKADITFLCDADLTGLSDKVIKQIIEPVASGDYDLCVGVRKRGGKLLQALRRSVFPLIAGERVMKTKYLREVLASEHSKDWGVELYMNYYFKEHKLKVKKVDLEGVMDVLNVKKRGIVPYVKRLFQFMRIYYNLFLLRFKKK